MPRVAKKSEQLARAGQPVKCWQTDIHKRRRFFVAAGSILAVLFIVLGLFNIVYAEKVYPGVVVGGIKASGLTQEELTARLDEKVRAVHDIKLIVTVEDREFTVTPTKDWQLSYDVEGTAARALAVGRGEFGAALKSQLTALFVGIAVPPDYSVNHHRFRTWIEDRTWEVEDPERDASFYFKDGELAVEPEKIGKRILGDGLASGIANALVSLDFTPMAIDLAAAHPAITADLAKKAKPVVAKIISGDLLLAFEPRSSKLSPQDLLELVELAADPALPDGIAVIISEPKVMRKVEAIAKNIDRAPVDAKLTISDGRASVFTPSRDGFRVKRDEVARDIAAALSKRRDDVPVAELALAVEVTKPAVRTETINNLGIKELIGKATTSFAGSPPNRVHNITIGANSFNGLLISPGETFSTIAALGTIDSSTGYRAELVIKEDRLIPETGGGLCQVSTTLFRVALNAGLPIVERRNHSFRVRYYEPPVGMDATIYDPAPDLKFTNDTPGYILIQAKVEGTKITFELYGTSDGRVATTTAPVVYNIVQPGSPVYIEDPSLGPGEQVQIEKAVPGADARFTYTVKRGGATVYQKTFSSRYIAWRAKFRVGPAAPPPPAEPLPPAEPVVGQ